MQQELAAKPAPDAAKEAELRKQIRQLQKDLTQYKLHLEQYAVCRAKLAQAERALRYNDEACVLYRDFVNQYNELGGHVKNLIFVKITRGEDGELVVHKINNFCSDKDSAGCDAFYMADVMDFHFKTKEAGGSGMFDGITSITLGGDHGPHFACNETVFNETRVWDLYGKKLHDLFLCSYHAYNRCDGAGVNVKQSAQAASRDARGPHTAADYSRLMNTSNYPHTFSFTFAKINRGVGIFPKLRKMPGVKKFCEMVFTAPDGSPSEPGVVRARRVPDEGAFTVFDLLPRPKDWGHMCKKCSDGEQRPVYHKKEKTRCHPTEHALSALDAEQHLREQLPDPDPARITEAQVPRKKRKAAAAGPPEKKMKVAELKAALLELEPGINIYGLYKDDLVQLLVTRRADGAAVKAGTEAAKADADAAVESAGKDADVESEDEAALAAHGESVSCRTRARGSEGLMSLAGSDSAEGSDMSSADDSSHRGDESSDESSDESNAESSSSSRQHWSERPVRTVASRDAAQAAFRLRYLSPVSSALACARSASSSSAAASSSAASSSAASSSVTQPAQFSSDGARDLQQHEAVAARERLYKLQAIAQQAEQAAGPRSIRAGDWVQWIRPGRGSERGSRVLSRVVRVAAHTLGCAGQVWVDAFPRVCSLSGWDRVLGELWSRPVNFHEVSDCELITSDCSGEWELESEKFAREVDAERVVQSGLVTELSGGLLTPAGAEREVGSASMPQKKKSVPQKGISCKSKALPQPTTASEANAKVQAKGKTTEPVPLAIELARLRRQLT